MKGLKFSLLRRQALESLNIIQVTQIDWIEGEEDPCFTKYKERFPRLFEALGKIEGEYDILLKKNYRPVAIQTPRRVALALLPKVKSELQRMEKEGQISPIATATDWCARMVMVPNENGCLRTCVDLTNLNNAVKREMYPILPIDYTSTKLKGAKHFSKLDAKHGFRKTKHSEKSKLITTFITPFGRYCFNALPFGINSATKHFSRKM